MDLENRRRPTSSTAAMVAETKAPKLRNPDIYRESMAKVVEQFGIRPKTEAVM